jgi:hypothetical protein
MRGAPVRSGVGRTWRGRGPRHSSLFDLLVKRALCSEDATQGGRVTEYGPSMADAFEEEIP